MKKMIFLAAALCLLLAGCASGKGGTAADIGDVDAGDIDKGVYVKTESNNIYTVEWGYDNQSGGCVIASGKAFETDVYTMLTADIMEMAEEKGKPIDFTVTAKKKNGEVFAKKDFTYQQGIKRMELVIGQDGTIRE